MGNLARNRWLLLVLVLGSYISFGFLVEQEIKRVTTYGSDRPLTPEELGAKPIPGLDGLYLTEEELRRQQEIGDKNFEAIVDLERATAMIEFRIIGAMVLCGLLTPLLARPKFSGPMLGVCMVLSIVGAPYSTIRALDFTAVVIAAALAYFMSSRKADRDPPAA